MMAPILSAMCVCAIFYAGGLFATNPEASIVIVSIAAGFLGIFYAAMTGSLGAEGEDDSDPPLPS